MAWETVIGLEIHIQLATNAKLFSGASTQFGAEPNTQACAIDLAMPGTLPVPNAQAFRYAVMFGLAIDADINLTSVFERKNYFYPDLPKGYQTTQLAQPIVGAGKVEITLNDGSTKTVRIHHAHLEEDAGKSLHEAYPLIKSHGSSGIDLNRAGTPLIEVVTEPDMRNAEEAVAFAKQLHSIVTALEICDGEMSQGSMRFDVNISVRKQGQEKLGTRTETKNLNSFKFMEEAIALEVERQIDVLEDGGTIKQETRLYNGDTKTARAMRSKEESMDYRYFPCPDLLPVVFTQQEVDDIRAHMPELPQAKQARYQQQFQLSTYDAQLLAGDRHIANYFEQALAAGGDPKLLANWLMGEVSARLNKEEKGGNQIPIHPQQLAQLVKRISDNTLSSKTAKTVFDALWQQEGEVDNIIGKRGLQQVSDSGALEAMVDEVIANNPSQVDNYRNADDKKRPKMLGFFVGQIMKASKGQANPQLVNEILLRKLDS